MVTLCEEAQEAISARLDGERHPVAGAALEMHLGNCQACRGFEAEVVDLGRRAGLRSPRTAPEDLPGDARTSPPARASTPFPVPATAPLGAGLPLLLGPHRAVGGGNRAGRACVCRTPIGIGLTATPGPNPSAVAVHDRPHRTAPIGRELRLASCRYKTGRSRRPVRVAMPDPVRCFDQLRPIDVAPH